MSFLMRLYLFFAFVLPGILAGETAPVPDCGKFETVCCDGDDTESVPSVGAVVHGCTQFGKIKKCEHPEAWWCCSSFMPPPGSDTGVALGCAEAWPDYVLCPSLPNRKAKRRPSNLSRRNKCDERKVHEFIQKMPNPGILPVPGLTPGFPVLVPINYELPSLPNDPSLTTATKTTTSSQDRAPLSGIFAGSMVDTAAGQQPSSSFYLPSTDESILSQLPSLDSSDGGSDAQLDQLNTFPTS